MDSAESDGLAFMGFPKEHWRQIASTNPLERVNKEIKRRANVIGIFPNDAAIVRLVGALVTERTEEWHLTRRYMSRASLSKTLNPTMGIRCWRRRTWLRRSIPETGRYPRSCFLI